MKRPAGLCLGEREKEMVDQKYDHIGGKEEARISKRVNMVLLARIAVYKRGRRDLDTHIFPIFNRWWEAKRFKRFIIAYYCLNRLID